MVRSMGVGIREQRRWQLRKNGRRVCVHTFLPHSQHSSKADIQARSKGVNSSNPRAGQLSAKLDAERKSPSPATNERMMVCPLSLSLGWRRLMSRMRDSGTRLALETIVGSPPIPPSLDPLGMDDKQARSSTRRLSRISSSSSVSRKERASASEAARHVVHQYEYPLGPIFA